MNVDFDLLNSYLHKLKNDDSVLRDESFECHIPTVVYAPRLDFHPTRRGEKGTHIYDEEEFEGMLLDERFKGLHSEILKFISRKACQLDMEGNPIRVETTENLEVLRPTFREAFHDSCLMVSCIKTRYRLLERMMFKEVLNYYKGKQKSHVVLEKNKNCFEPTATIRTDIIFSVSFSMIDTFMEIEKAAGVKPSLKEKILSILTNAISSPHFTLINLNAAKKLSVSGFSLSMKDHSDFRLIKNLTNYYKDEAQQFLDGEDLKMFEDFCEKKGDCRVFLQVNAEGETPLSDFELKKLMQKILLAIIKGDPSDIFQLLLPLIYDASLTSARKRSGKFTTEDIESENRKSNTIKELSEVIFVKLQELCCFKNFSPELGSEFNIKKLPITLDYCYSEKQKNDTSFLGKIATDGDYYYIFRVGKYFKVGTGKNDTIKGKTYLCEKGSLFIGWVTCFGKRLFVRQPQTTRNRVLFLELSKKTLKVIGVVIDSNEDSMENFQITSNSKNIIALSRDNSMKYWLRFFSITKDVTSELRSYARTKIHLYDVEVNGCPSTHFVECDLPVLYARENRKVLVDTSVVLLPTQSYKTAGQVYGIRKNGFKVKDEVSVNISGKWFCGTVVDVENDNVTVTFNDKKLNDIRIKSDSNKITTNTAKKNPGYFDSKTSVLWKHFTETKKKGGKVWTYFPNSEKIEEMYKSNLYHEKKSGPIKTFYDFSKMIIKYVNQGNEIPIEREQNEHHAEPMLEFIEDIHIFVTETHVGFIYPNSNYLYGNSNSFAKIFDLEHLILTKTTKIDSRIKISDVCFEKNNSRLLIYDSVNSEIILQGRSFPRNLISELKNQINNSNDLVTFIIERLDYLNTKILSVEKKIFISNDFVFFFVSKNQNYFYYVYLFIKILFKEKENQFSILRCVIESLRSNTAFYLNCKKKNDSSCSEIFEKLADLFVEMLLSKIEKRIKEEVISVIKIAPQLYMPESRCELFKRLIAKLLAKSSHSYLAAPLIKIFLHHFGSYRKLLNNFYQRLFCEKISLSYNVRSKLITTIYEQIFIVADKELVEGMIQCYLRNLLRLISQAVEGQNYQNMELFKRNFFTVLKHTSINRDEFKLETLNLIVEIHKISAAFLKNTLEGRKLFAERYRKNLFFFFKTIIHENLKSKPKTISVSGNSYFLIKVKYVKIKRDNSTDPKVVFSTNTKKWTLDCVSKKTILVASDFITFQRIDKGITVRIYKYSNEQSPQTSAIETITFITSNCITDLLQLKEMPIKAFFDTEIFSRGTREAIIKTIELRKEENKKNTSPELETLRNPESRSNLSLTAVDRLIVLPAYVNKTSYFRLRNALQKAVRNYFDLETEKMGIKVLAKELINDNMKHYCKLQLCQKELFGIVDCSEGNEFNMEVVANQVKEKMPPEYREDILHGAKTAEEFVRKRRKLSASSSLVSEEKIIEQIYKGLQVWLSLFLKTKYLKKNSKQLSGMITSFFSFLKVSWRYSFEDVLQAMIQEERLVNRFNWIFKTVGEITEELKWNNYLVETAIVGALNCSKMIMAARSRPAFWAKVKHSHQNSLKAVHEFLHEVFSERPESLFDDINLLRYCVKYMTLTGEFEFLKDFSFIKTWFQAASSLSEKVQKVKTRVFLGDKAFPRFDFVELQDEILRAKYILEAASNYVKAIYFNMFIQASQSNETSENHNLLKTKSQLNEMLLETVSNTIQTLEFESPSHCDLLKRRDANSGYKDLRRIWSEKILTEYLRMILYALKYTDKYDAKLKISEPVRPLFDKLVNLIHKKESIRIVNTATKIVEILIEDRTYLHQFYTDHLCDLLKLVGRLNESPNRSITPQQCPQSRIIYEDEQRVFKVQIITASPNERYKDPEAKRRTLKQLEKSGHYFAQILNETAFLDNDNCVYSDENRAACYMKKNVCFKSFMDHLFRSIERDGKADIIYGSKLKCRKYAMKLAQKGFGVVIKAAKYSKPYQLNVAALFETGTLNYSFGGKYYQAISEGLEQLLLKAMNLSRTDPTNNHFEFLFTSFLNQEEDSKRYLLSGLYRILAKDALITAPLIQGETRLGEILENQVEAFVQIVESLNSEKVEKMLEFINLSDLNILMNLVLVTPRSMIGEDLIKKLLKLIIYSPKQFLSKYDMVKLDKEILVLEEKLKEFNLRKWNWPKKRLKLKTEMSTMRTFDGKAPYCLYEDNLQNVLYFGGNRVTEKAESLPVTVLSTSPVKVGSYFEVKINNLAKEEIMGVGMCSQKIIDEGKNPLGFCSGSFAFFSSGKKGLFKNSPKQFRDAQSTEVGDVFDFYKKDSKEKWLRGMVVDKTPSTVKVRLFDQGKKSDFWTTGNPDTVKPYLSHSRIGTPGQFFFESYGEEFEDGNTIGCVICPEGVFFSKNGCLMEKAFEYSEVCDLIKKQQLRFAISMPKFTRVSANFGRKHFLLDLKKIPELCEKDITPFSPLVDENLQREINQIVLHSPPPAVVESSNLRALTLPLNQGVSPRGNPPSNPRPPSSAQTEMPQSFIQRFERIETLFDSLIENSSSIENIYSGGVENLLGRFLNSINTALRQQGFGDGLINLEGISRFSELTVPQYLSIYNQEMIPDAYLRPDQMSIETISDQSSNSLVFQTISDGNKKTNLVAVGTKVSIRDSVMSKVFSSSHFNPIPRIYELWPFGLKAFLDAHGVVRKIDKKRNLCLVEFEKFSLSQKIAIWMPINCVKEINQHEKNLFFQLSRNLEKVLFEKTYQKILKLITLRFGTSFSAFNNMKLWGNSRIKEKRKKILMALYQGSIQDIYDLKDFSELPRNSTFSHILEDTKTTMEIALEMVKSAIKETVSNKSQIFFCGKNVKVKKLFKDYQDCYLLWSEHFKANSNHLCISQKGELKIPKNCSIIVSADEDCKTRLLEIPHKSRFFPKRFKTNELWFFCIYKCPPRSKPANKIESVKIFFTLTFLSAELEIGLWIMCSKSLQLAKRKARLLSHGSGTGQRGFLRNDGEVLALRREVEDSKKNANQAIQSLFELCFLESSSCIVKTDYCKIASFFLFFCPYDNIDLNILTTKITFLAFMNSWEENESKGLGHTNYYNAILELYVIAAFYDIRKNADGIEKISKLPFVNAFRELKVENKKFEEILKESCSFFFETLKLLWHGKSDIDFIEKLFAGEILIDTPKTRELIEARKRTNQNESEQNANETYILNLDRHILSLLMNIDMNKGFYMRVILGIKEIISFENKQKYIDKVCKITGITQKRLFITVDRLQSDIEPQKRTSVFTQLFQELKDVSSYQIKVKPPSDGSMCVAFIIRFKNEEAIGEGGPYREVFEIINDDVFGGKKSLKMFTPTPNFENAIGEDRYLFVPRVEKSNKHVLRFFGKIVGLAFRSKILMHLPLPRVFFKTLVGEKLDRDDLLQIDHSFVKLMIETIESVKSEEELQAIGVDLSFEPELKSFDRESLVGKRVTFENRLRYTKAKESLKMREYQESFKDVCEGFWEVFPRSALRILGHRELANEICGTPKIDLELLKKHTVYEGCTKDSRFIRFFWKVLEELKDAERSRFIEFAYASKRLPSTSSGYRNRRMRLLLKPLSVPPGRRIDDAFPKAETCFFNLSIPEYTSQEVASRQIQRVLKMDWGMSGDDVTRIPENLLSRAVSSQEPQPREISTNARITLIVHREGGRAPAGPPAAAVLPLESMLRSASSARTTAPSESAPSGQELTVVNLLRQGVEGAEVTDLSTESGGQAGETQAISSPPEERNRAPQNSGATAPSGQDGEIRAPGGRSTAASLSGSSEGVATDDESSYSDEFPYETPSQSEE